MTFKRGEVLGAACAKVLGGILGNLLGFLTGNEAPFL